MKKSIGILFIIIAIFVVGYPIYYKYSSEIIEITIKDKERITTGTRENIKGKFIIYTEKEVFENSDSWMYLKFSSSDYQNRMDIGKIYRVKVAGWRIPILSKYRNIVEIIED